MNDAKVIITNIYEINMNNGIRYRVECGDDEIDYLIDLIGEHNIIDMEALW